MPRMRRPLYARCICVTVISISLISVFVFLWASDPVDNTELGTESSPLSLHFPPPSDFLDTSGLCVSLHRSPRFSPRHIGDSLRKDFYNESYNKDMPITRQDLSRAALNVLSPLPMERYGGSMRFIQKASAAGEMLMTFFANFVLDAAYDAAPIIADYGCRIATAFARRHSRSTVLCIADDEIGARPQEVALPNVLRVYARGGIFPAPVKGATGRAKGFSPFFFSSCSFMSVATLFTAAVPLLLDTQRESENATRGILDTAVAALYNSGALLVTLSPEMAADCDTLLSHLRAREYLAKDIFSLSEDTMDWLRPRCTLECEAVASLSRPHTNKRVLTLFQVKVTRAASACRKTFFGPLVQWDRTVLRDYRETRLFFRVVDTAAGERTAENSVRRISPLQIVPSVGLDTLLGAGLSAYERLRLFGDMLTLPRYADPLPHNWMVGNADIAGSGGRAFRIDTADKRFESAVREEQNYWAKHSRGYVRLLAYHMCLPLREGVPEVMFALSENCRAQCRTCITACVYGPNGAAPCEACVQCGTCVRRHAEQQNGKGEKAFISGHPHGTLQEAEICSRNYRNYRDGVARWDKWRREDARHPIKL